MVIGSERKSLKIPGSPPGFGYLNNKLPPNLLLVEGLIEVFSDVFLAGFRVSIRS